MRGIGLIGKRAQLFARLVEQLVVQCPPLGGQRHAALFYLAKARRVATKLPCRLTFKSDLFIQRLEAGLAQQDGALTARWPFNHRFRRNAAFWHLGLNVIDIQRARCQVVNVRPAKSHHVGNQAMLGVQLLILLQRDRRRVVPAESFQRLLHKLVGMLRAEATVALVLLNQFNRARGENVAFCQH